MNGLSKQQVGNVADRIRDRYGAKKSGGAWHYMHEDHRDAAVCREALFTVLGLHRGGAETATVDLDEVRKLLQGVRDELGMGGDE
jgi:hypothetical protein